MKEITDVPVKEKKVAQSAAEQYRKALEAAEAIKQTAVDELKKSINAQIEELNGFGFDFRLSEGGKPAKKAATTRKRSEICSICNFATNPPHDGRLKFHRDQET